MNKKAQNAMLVNLIKGVLVLVLLLGLVSQIFGSFDDDFKNSALGCRASILAQDLTSFKKEKSGFGAEVSVIKNTCKTLSTELEIKESDFLSKDKPEGVVYKELADMIAFAWWMVGEGKVKDVFTDKHFGFITPLDAIDEDYTGKCVNLIDVTIPYVDNYKDLPLNTIELSAYMKTQKYKVLTKDKIRQEFTYDDYITSYKGRGSVIYFSSEMKMGEEYSIALIEKPEEPGDLVGLKETLCTTAGVAASITTTPFGGALAWGACQIAANQKISKIEEDHRDALNNWKNSGPVSYKNTFPEADMLLFGTKDVIAKVCQDN